MDNVVVGFSVNQNLMESHNHTQKSDDVEIQSFNFLFETKLEEGDRVSYAFRNMSGSNLVISEEAPLVYGGEYNG